MAFSIPTGFFLFDIGLIFGAAFLAVFVYYQHSFQYWKKKGVPYIKPKFPYGNNIYLFPRSLTFAGEAQTWYEYFKSKGHKFGGVWTFSRKVLVLVDPDYIRDILSQDFHYFIDRDIYVNERDDPIGTHLFNISSHSWKPLRQKLTPTFTSGKMKMMFDSVVNCSNMMVKHLEKCAQMGDDIEIREVLASFTTDVIGTVAFGIDCNSFDEKQAEFRKQGREMFHPSLKDYVRMMLEKNFPDLSKTFGLKVGNPGPKAFFTEMVRQTIEYRHKNNIHRPDFLQLLIDMCDDVKDGQRSMKFEQIVANTILFFVAGFDTSSTAMTFTLYELARNPEIQEKTRQEINKVLKKYNGQITYESLQEMTYLGQVLDETLRKFPSLITLARICTKSYTLRDTDIVIEKGTPVVISTLALGRDPDHFPNPEKYDPDRFSPEEKAKRHPYVHLPFGEGPRNCIGLRFGVMQSKIGIVQVLRNFKVTISSKTKMPLTIDPRIFLLKENETLYLNAERI